MELDLFNGASLDLDRIPLYRGKGYRLFKTLLSNACRMDCKYCPFSRVCRFPRDRWEKKELVDRFLRSYRDRRVNGFFLSSSLYGDPERVVEDEIEVIDVLRRRGYRGYIHLRLMPGTPKDLLFQAVVLSDRAGLNIEAPRDVFREIAPSKGDWLNDIVKRIEWLVSLKKKFKRWGMEEPGYLSRGIDTQFVLGAGDETDREVLETAWYLLEIGVDRIYVSGFKPYKGIVLENRRPAPRWRTRRVIQAIELMRVYKYRLDDILLLLDNNDMLPDRDPKVAYAELNPNMFPVDLNNDPLEAIIKVPGIGPKSARKIIELRNQGTKITAKHLKEILGYKRFLKAYKYIIVTS
mgnify:CR=1 FL=1